MNGIRELRDVGPREHRHHAGQTPSGVDVDAADQRMGVRAAHERGVQHVGHGDVVDVATRAGEQARVLDPSHLRADEPTCDRFAHRVAPLVRCRSRRMSRSRQIRTLGRSRSTRRRGTRVKACSPGTCPDEHPGPVGSPSHRGDDRAWAEPPRQLRREVRAPAATLAAERDRRSDRAGRPRNEESREKRGRGRSADNSSSPRSTVPPTQWTCSAHHWVGTALGWSEPHPIGHFAPALAKNLWKYIASI